MERERIIWEYVLQIIKNKVTLLVYETWIEPTRLHRIDDLGRKIVIIVPNKISRDWLKQRYTAYFEESFLRVTKLNYQAEFVVEEM